MNTIRWPACCLMVLLLASSASAQQGLRWEANLDSARALAAQTNRLVLVHFSASWCGPCKQLEQNVFSQPGFGQQLVGQYVAVKLDFDAQQALASQLGVEKIPTDVVLTPQGQVVQKFVSPQTAEQYTGALQQIAAAAGYRGQPAQPQYAAQPSAPGPQQGMPTQQPQSPAAQPSSRGMSDDRYADYYNSRGQGAALAAQPYAPQPSVAPSPYTPAAPPAAPMMPSGAPSGAPGSPYGNLVNAPQPSPASQPAAPSQPTIDPRYADQRYAATPTQPAVPQPAAPAVTQPMAPQQPAASQPAASQPTVPQPYNVAQPATPPAIQPPAMQPPAMQPSASNTAAAPQGNPPMGLDGFCPVTLIQKKQWIKGDTRWGAIHRGRTYLFTSPEAQQQFLASPDAFSPTMSGDDPVLALDHNQAIPGRRQHGVFYGGKVYLFSSEASLDVFSKNPGRYTAEAQQARR